MIIYILSKLGNNYSIIDVQDKKKPPHFSHIKGESKEGK